MRRFVAALAAGLAFATAPGLATDRQPTLSGDIRIHDPSVIALPDGSFVAYETGRAGMTRGAIGIRTSPDGLGLDRGGLDRQGRAEMGGRGAGLPLAEHLGTLGVEARRHLFSLLFGVVLRHQCQRHRTDDGDSHRRPRAGRGLGRPRARAALHCQRQISTHIDPWRIDTSDGRAFLAFGSFWDGIRDDANSIRFRASLSRSSTPMLPIASRQGAGIEAPSIIEHQGKFYLFVSFDQCCRKGVQSSYNIRVGRADAATGP